MYRFLGFISFFLLSIFVNAQNFKLQVQNEVYTSCSVDLDDIEILRINQFGLSDKYIKDGLEFTGCAKAILKNIDGFIQEYMVTEIVDGYPLKSTYYFRDGSLSREFNFKDGKSHGLHIMYYENGGKYIEEFYQNGRPHGTTKRWTKEGKLARDAFFQVGIPIYDVVYVKDDNC